MGVPVRATGKGLDWSDGCKEFGTRPRLCQIAPNHVLQANHQIPTTPAELDLAHSLGYFLLPRPFWDQGNPGDRGEAYFVQPVSGFGVFLFATSKFWTSFFTLPRGRFDFSGRATQLRHLPQVAQIHTAALGTDPGFSGASSNGPTRMAAGISLELGRLLLVGAAKRNTELRSSFFWFPSVWVAKPINRATWGMHG